MFGAVLNTPLRHFAIPQNNFLLQQKEYVYKKYFLNIQVANLPRIGRNYF